MVMKNCVIDGPKFFREMNNLELEGVDINDADETFWRINGLKLTNVKLHDGTYPFMFSSNIYVDGLESDSKYRNDIKLKSLVYHKYVVCRAFFTNA